MCSTTGNRFSVVCRNDRSWCRAWDSNCTPMSVIMVCETPNLATQPERKWYASSFLPCNLAQGSLMPIESGGRER